MLKEILNENKQKIEEDGSKVLKIGLEDGIVVVKSIFNEKNNTSLLKIKYNDKNCEYKTNGIDVFEVKGDIADILNSLIQELYLEGEIREV